MQLMLRQAKRMIIGVLGLTVLAIGLAMILLPGPAFLVIPAGIAILATEFVWAKTLLTRLKYRTARARVAARRSWRRRPPTQSPTDSPISQPEV